MTNQKKKLRVLFIGPTPPPFSGPEMGMQLFLSSQLRDAFDIRHLRTNVRQSNKNKGRFDIAMLVAFFRFVGSLFSALMRFRPLVAYYPITATQAGWIGRDSWCLIMCRIFGVATIIHMRGSHFRLNYKKFSVPVKWVVRLSCNKVALALVQAKYLEDQFKGLIPDESIRVLHNAIDTRNFVNLSLSEYNRLSILFMGHLTKAKGYCDLARAIPLVAEKYPDVEFHVAGTLRKGERGVFYDQFTGKPIEYEDPFRFHDKLRRGSSARNYFFHGIVAGEEKIDLIRNCAIYVSPSYSEGFSRAILEAMSMGKAIVCTPVGAHRELLCDGRNAIFVKPGDVPALAAAICMLLEDQSLRKRIGEENYEYARKAFDIDTISGQLGQYIEQAVSMP